MTVMPRSDRELFEDLATCLEYPGIGFEDKKSAARRHLYLDETPVRRRLGRAFANLARHFSEQGPSRCEEAYTRLFDLSPVCTPHLGYHLYGDAYERGELLAHLMPEVERVGVRLEGELPDFLPVLLRLLARLPDEEDRKLLVEHLVAPGLAKMVAALEKADDPWSAVVRASDELVRELVAPTLPVIEEAPLHA